jgi:hypothetical protein
MAAAADPAFWNRYWGAILDSQSFAASSETWLTDWQALAIDHVRRGALSSLSSVQPLSMSPSSVFRVAWSAHSLLTMDPEWVFWIMDSEAGTATSNPANDNALTTLMRRGRGGIEGLFSPPLQLATVLALHACSLLYLELDVREDHKHGLSSPQSPSKSLALSPFFPLLVQDALDTLSSLQKHPTRDRTTQEVIDGFYQFVETCVLPSLLGPDKWGRVQHILSDPSSSSGAGLTGVGAPMESISNASIMSILQEAVVEWIPAAACDTRKLGALEWADATVNADSTPICDYVSPFVWARTESELNDLKRILDKPNTTSDSNNVLLPASTLLEPMTGIRAPFARPLPPPLLPICGCECVRDYKFLCVKEKLCVRCNT